MVSIFIYIRKNIYMKSSFLMTFCAVLFFTSSFAQNSDFEMGLLFDENEYNALPQMSVPSLGMAFESVDLPRTYSVKRYAPYAGNQGRIGSCMAWALGYGAQTIEWARQRNITDRTVITQQAFGAMYIYNHVKVNVNTTSCNGSYPETALSHAKNRGNILLSEYNPYNCQETPPASLDSRAAKNRILEYVSLFQTSDSPDRKIGFIKNAIAQDKPVVIAMRLTATFYDAKGIWYPGSDPNPYGPHGRHAMVIVGFDDDAQVFEVLNSWGTDWGNSGFINIRYRDMKTYLDAAYQIILPPPANEKISLAGQFNFRYSINLAGKPMGDATAYYNSSRQYYELSRKDWQLDQRFQLVVNTQVKGQYLYVFSVNDSYEANTHFPIGSSYSNGVGLKNDDIDIVPLKSEFIIPEPERNANGELIKEKSLRISTVGTDYLVILYSAKSLKADLPTIIETTRSHMAWGRTPRQALESALGNRLMPLADIRYDSNKVGFSAASYSGYVAPLIIRVDSN